MLVLEILLHCIAEVRKARSSIPSHYYVSHKRQRRGNPQIEGEEGINSGAKSRVGGHRKKFKEVRMPMSNPASPEINV